MRLSFLPLRRRPPDAIAGGRNLGPGGRSISTEECEWAEGTNPKHWAGIVASACIAEDGGSAALLGDAPTSTLHHFTTFRIPTDPPPSPQMTPSPLLGTAYILSQSPSSNSASSVQKTPITPSLCANLSAFKSLLRQSRALDDSVILRLNRAHALARANPALRECDAFWKELVERWTERGRVLGFCEGVVVRTMDGEEGGKGEGKVPIEVRLDRDRAAKVGRGESEGELKVRLFSFFFFSP